MMLATPRASTPISCRIRGAEHLNLTVVAVTSAEEAEAMSVLDSSESQDVGRSDAKRALIQLTVHLDGSKAFADLSAVGRLSEPEFDDLYEDVELALADISPSYGRSNSAEWIRVLETGASHHSNLIVASRLSSCVDISYGYGIKYTNPRPDRFFGVPTHALTDGQWMAFDAARSLMAKRHKDD